MGTSTHRKLKSGEAGRGSKRFDPCPLNSFREVEEEVDKKVQMASRYRMAPCLHVSHILPGVPWARTTGTTQNACGGR